MVRSAVWESTPLATLNYYIEQIMVDFLWRSLWYSEQQQLCAPRLTAIAYTLSFCFRGMTPEISAQTRSSVRRATQTKNPARTIRAMMTSSTHISTDTQSKTQMKTIEAMMMSTSRKMPARMMKLMTNAKCEYDGDIYKHQPN